jgi:hypothetical protein
MSPEKGTPMLQAETTVIFSGKIRRPSKREGLGVMLTLPDLIRRGSNVKRRSERASAVAERSSPVETRGEMEKLNAMYADEIAFSTALRPYRKPLPELLK